MAAPRRVDELKLLQADYFNLRTHCDKIQAKANEQAKDLKETRRLNETLDKNLSALRRKYEQLSLDKRELDEQAEANREYAKRVEQKLLMGSKGQYLSDKNIELRDKNRALKKELQERADIISSQEAELHKAATQIQILSRALDSACIKSGFGDEERSLLMTVAEKNEDNVRLAMQLARANELVRVAEDGRREAEDEAQQLTAALQNATARERATRDEFDSVAARVEGLNKEIGDLQQERGVMLDYIQDMTDKLAASERGARAAAEAAGERERTLRSSAEQAARRAAEADTKAEDARSRLDSLSRVVSVTEAALAADRRRLEAAEDARRGAEEEGEIAAETARRLKDQLEGMQSSMEEMRSRFSSLDAQARRHADKNRQLSQALEEKDRVECELKRAMEDSLAELAAIGSEREAAAAASAEAVALSAKSSLDVQRMEERLAAATREAAELRSSKALLQSTMLEQLASTRVQLRNAQEALRVATQQQNPA